MSIEGKGAKAATLPRAPFYPNPSLHLTFVTRTLDKVSISTEI